MLNLSGKTVALYIHNEYEDLEAWYPYYRLKEAGADVHVLGPERGRQYVSKHGYPMESTHGIENVSIGEYDALIIPGGYAPDKMRANAGMVDFVHAMHKAGRPIAAICHGGWMLASAGIVDGVKVTSVSNITDDLVNAGAEWVNEEVVQDSNLITSRTPQDLPVFMRTVLYSLDASDE
jgi:protease I